MESSIKTSQTRGTEKPKPALGPKPRLAPKPFSLQKNNIIHSIHAPKTVTAASKQASNHSRKAEGTGVPKETLNPPAQKAPQQTTTHVSKPSSVSVHSKDKPNTTKGSQNKEDTVNSSVAPGKSVPALQSTASKETPKPEPVPKEDVIQTNNKAPEVTVSNTEQKDAKNKGDKPSVLQKPEESGRESSPTAKPTNRWGSTKKRLSVELTSKFESGGQSVPPKPSVIVSTTKNKDNVNKPASSAPERCQTTPEPSNKESDDGELKDYSEGGSIKRRISLLFDSSSRPEVMTKKEEPEIVTVSQGVKERIKNWCMETSSEPLKPQLPIRTRSRSFESVTSPTAEKAPKLTPAELTTIGTPSIPTPSSEVSQTKQSTETPVKGSQDAVEKPLGTSTEKQHEQNKSTDVEVQLPNYSSSTAQTATDEDKSASSETPQQPLKRDNVKRRSVRFGIVETDDGGPPLILGSPTDSSSEDEDPEDKGEEKVPTYRSVGILQEKEETIQKQEEEKPKHLEPEKSMTAEENKLARLKLEEASKKQDEEEKEKENAIRRETLRIVEEEKRREKEKLRRLKEEEIERQKQEEKEREKLKEEENKRKQLEEIERERQVELMRQRQREDEKERAKQIEERLKKDEEEREKERLRKLKEEEIERQKQEKERERLKEEENKRKQLEEVERERQMEFMRQRQREEEKERAKQIEERLKKDEEERERERLRKLKEEELERQKQEERERERLKEEENKRKQLEEVERERQVELMRQRQREEEKERAKQIEERLKKDEEEREKERLRKLKEEEIERQKQEEKERERLKEEENKRKLLEEIERERQMELMRQRQREEEKERAKQIEKRLKKDQEERLREEREGQRLREVEERPVHEHEGTLREKDVHLERKKELVLMWQGPKEEDREKAKETEETFRQEETEKERLRKEAEERERERQRRLEEEERIARQRQEEEEGRKRTELERRMKQEKLEEMERMKQIQQRREEERREEEKRRQIEKQRLEELKRKIEEVENQRAKELEEKLRMEKEQEKQLTLFNLQERVMVESNVTSLDSKDVAQKSDMLHSPLKNADEPTESQIEVVYDDFSVRKAQIEVDFDDFSVKPRRWGSQAKVETRPVQTWRAEPQVKEEVEGLVLLNFRPLENKAPDQVAKPDSPEPTPATESSEEEEEEEVEEEVEERPEEEQLIFMDIQKEKEDSESESDAEVSPQEDDTEDEDKQEVQVNSYCINSEDKDTDALIDSEPDQQNGICEHMSETNSPKAISEPVPEFSTQDDDTMDFHREPEFVPFPESPTPLLDTSAQRSKAVLGRRRSRSRPSRSLRLAQTKSPNWRVHDSTDETEIFTKHRDSDSEEEQPKSKIVCSPPPTSQRVPMIPGLSPAALIAQLKRRTVGGGAGGGDVAEEVKQREKENQHEEVEQSLVKLPRSPRPAARLAGAALVLPPLGSPDGGAVSSPAWLKELKTKKRFSQHDSEA
ncbi:trichohyalin-like [Channa argus]|uniref:trichohyalin-like n=1 Tax=Channa argus TaxID=215402 RepID=UPI0029457EDE|nr:hypothetical protein Q8A73_005394 [Channa argus]